MGWAKHTSQNNSIEPDKRHNPRPTQTNPGKTGLENNNRTLFFSICSLVFRGLGLALNFVMFVGFTPIIVLC